MRAITFYLFTVILLTAIPDRSYSQETEADSAVVAVKLDSLRKAGAIFGDFLKKPEISLSTGDAVKFLQDRLSGKYWKDADDPLRRAMNQLVFEASNPPFDSAEVFLMKYPFDSLDVSWDKFYIWEPVRLKIPVTPPRDMIIQPDTLPVSDSLVQVAASDTTIKEGFLMSATKALFEGMSQVKDTSILVVVDTLNGATSDRPGFPYTRYDHPFQSDSTQAAVLKLMEYLRERDSTIVYFSGSGNDRVPVWLNSKTDMMKRFWLRNELDDSVTVWVGASARNTVGLYLENGVSIRRPVMQGNFSEARVDVKEIDRSKLLEVQKITVKYQYWKYRAESSFALNQASVTNWVKGGESSISTALDLTGYADYVNKALKLTSNNFARLKYGLIWTDENGVRKNLDLLETNSKLNHKAFGKFDFSGIMLFKTQIAKGYNYPNDSIAVSKFLNPAILTVGFGLDYKPNKTTSLNFSPFSYKGTFVPDTAIVDKTKGIDQTKYGIAPDRKAKHEPGASFMISNEYSPVKTVKIVNRLQLFTNYINKPQNIDIDWEMIVTANLNWFTDVRFNTHLIFDNDTKTTVYDDRKQPVLGPDGKPKKTARIQFKEILGFSFVFRF